jgi:hypothetical protein
VPDPTPEGDPASLRFTRVARSVPNAGGTELDVLIQVWSDGTFTCALRSVNGARRVWNEPREMEAGDA